MLKNSLITFAVAGLSIASASSCRSQSANGGTDQPAHGGSAGARSVGGSGGHSVGQAGVSGASVLAGAGGVGGVGGASGVGDVGGVPVTTAGSGFGGNAGAADSGAAAGGRASAGAGGMTGSVAMAGSAGVAGAGSWMFPASISKPRIMIVGDSISAGPGCYKKYLLKNLTDNHYSRFEFVGAYADDCGGAVKHSAVSCSTASQYTQASFTLPNCAQGKTFSGLTPLANTYQPDLIMLQLGVNDVWGGASVDDVLSSYEALVKQARAVNPSVVLVVARIQKIAPSCTAGDPVTAKAQALVNAVPAWAQKTSLAQSPIFVADLWTNSDWSSAETTDCVHPNDVGAQRMGLNWYSALKPLLKPD